MKCARKVLWLLLVSPLFSQAQQTKKEKKGEFYFSWGYNKEWYTHSDVVVNQPKMQSRYTLQHVKSHDHIGWDEGIFSIPISIPQYNYRIGYFFNRKKGWAFEINFDHTKHIIQDGQSLAIKGMLNGRPVDSTINFSKANGFYYYLNNGANFLLFNLVKRWNCLEAKNNWFKLDALAKAGVGPVIPHVENSLFGQHNDEGFQLGGWNMGLEGALRGTFFKHAYLEFANKLDYANYSGLKVYKGTASQSFGTYELILNLGFTF